MVFVSVCSAFNDFRSDAFDKSSTRHLRKGEKVKMSGTWHQIATLIGHKLAVADVALEGNLVASSSYDGTVKLWDIKNAAQSVH